MEPIVKLENVSKTFKDKIYINPIIIIGVIIVPIMLPMKKLKIGIWLKQIEIIGKIEIYTANEIKKMFNILFFTL